MSGFAQSSRAVTTDVDSSGAVTNFPVGEILANAQFHSVAVDNRGILYFSYNRGIAEFDGVEWRIISTPRSTQINVLSIDQKGRIYATGKNEIGYLYVDDNGNTLFQSVIENVDVKDTFFSIEHVGDDVFFIGLKSLYKLNEDALIKIGEGSFIAGSSIGDNLIINDQERGLLFFDGKEFKSISKTELIRAYAMAKLDEQTLLISTRSSGLQILSFASNTPKIIPWKNNLSLFIDSSDISSISVFDEQLIAISSYRDGVAILDINGNVQKFYSTDNGLLNNNVFSTFFTLNGNLWVGLNNGVALINAFSVSQQKLAELDGSQFLIDEGSTDSSSFSMNTSKWYDKIIEIAKGWFHSEESESLDIPAESNATFVSIVRKVEYIPNDSLIFGGAFSQTDLSVQSLLQSDTLEYNFPFNINAFRFSYAANKYEDIGNISYQVKLEGLDRSWSTWSENTYREYTNLDWGEYIFSVRARNASGQLSHEAKFSFTIIPPWYESTWFYLIQFGSLFMALIISGILNKTGKAISLSEALIAVVVIVIFQYVDFYIDPYLDEYSNDIAVFKILISIIFGFSLEYIEEFFHKVIAKITGLTTTETQVQKT